MGHKNMDFDALGASLGVWALCKSLRTKAYVVYEDDNETEEFLLVSSSLEADPMQGKISKESPLGKAVFAANIYEKLGFVQVGCRPNYYRNPKEDALILRKEWEN